MPYIEIRMLKGVSLTQKRGLAKDVTEAVAKNLRCSLKDIAIELREFSSENITQRNTFDQEGV